MRESSTQTAQAGSITLWVTCVLVALQLVAIGLLVNRTGHVPSSHPAVASSATEGGDTAHAVSDRTAPWCLPPLFEDGEPELEACNAHRTAQLVDLCAVTTGVAVRDGRALRVVRQRWPKATCGERGPPAVTA